MGIHADDDVAAGSPNRHVQRRRRDVLHVVEQAHARIARHILLYDRSGPIRAHPVDDQYLHLIVRVLRRKD